jgi:hypothetical protein
MGWTSIRNGELLALASREFDVFVTVDHNLSFQLNLAGNFAQSADEPVKAAADWPYRSGRRRGSRRSSSLNEAAGGGRTRHFKVDASRPR